MRAGGLVAAIKRGIYHGLIVPVYRAPGKPTRYRLDNVDQFIRDYIYTGLIQQRRFLLPSEVKLSADASYRKGSLK